MVTRMGKYLDLANKYVKLLKPKIDKRMGIKLEDIIVKDASSYQPPLKPENFDDSRILMFVDPKYFKDTIFMYENHYDEHTLDSEINVCVAHELAHLVHNKINKEKERELFLGLKDVNDVSEEDLALESKIIMEHYDNHERTSFLEGFAKYLSLDYILDLYDEKTQFFAKCVSIDLLRYKMHAQTPEDDYQIGYNFFKKILDIIGKEKFLEIARSPPMSETEIRAPLLYLLRKYPAKYKKYSEVYNEPEYVKMFSDYSKPCECT